MSENYQERKRWRVWKFSKICSKS